MSIAARRHPVAAGRLCAHVEEPDPVGLAYGYVYFFRGTPLLAQTFPDLLRLRRIPAAAGSRSGSGGSSARPGTARVFAFSLNTAAYQAEILRGAIESVPQRPMGGRPPRSACTGCRPCRKVILPQALIVALRPYGNEIILMIKGSAVVALITVST